MSTTLNSLQLAEESTPEYVKDAVRSGNPYQSEKALRYLFEERDIRQSDVAELYGVGVPAIWKARKEFGISCKGPGRPTKKEVRSKEANADDAQTGLGEW